MYSVYTHPESDCVWIAQDGERYDDPCVGLEASGLTKEEAERKKYEIEKRWGIAKMRVLILDINHMHLNGASTYTLHLKAGLEKLGHHVTLVASTGRGKPLKGSEEHSAITWLKEKDVELYVRTQEWDVIHLNDGQFDCKDYTFLKWLGEIPDTVRSFTVHGRKNFHLLSCENLFKHVPMQTIFTVDMGCIQQFQPYAQVVKMIELPFAREIMPEFNGNKQSVVICPSRFFLGKFPEDVAKVFLAIQSQLIGTYKVRFFGYESFYAHLRAAEEIFKNPLFEMNPSYKFAQKSTVYGAAEFMFDGSNIANLGSGRIQYTSLEAMHYGAVPVIRSQWMHPNITAFDMQSEDLIAMMNDKSMVWTAINENWRHLEEHYRADKIAQNYVTVWERFVK